MGNVLRTVGALFLIVNTLGVGWLVYQERRKNTFEVSAQAVSQMEKLYQMVLDSRAELEKLSQAPFPSEEKVKEWKGQSRERDLLFEATRLAYLDARRKKTVESVGLFLALGRAVVAPPTFSFSTYDTKTMKYVPFANLSKLESIEADYEAFTLAALRDIK